MTDAQTEARAVVSAILADKRLTARYNVEVLTDVIVENIATALAAKDAELATVKAELFQSRNFWSEELSAKNAQLAEANKALEPFAAIADTEDEVGRDDPEDDRVWIVQAHGCQIGDLTVEHFRAARRAREQGGE